MPNAPASPFQAAMIAELPRLRRYAAALAGSVAAADDLVQDCIERALSRSATLQDVERMGAWLRAILHNLHTDEMRRRKRRGIGIEISAMADDPVLSTAAEASSRSTDYVKALQHLSVEHRQVILLIALEGLEYREAADELGIPIGTVMSRMARARERLRNILEQEQVTPNGEGISARRFAL